MKRPFFLAFALLLIVSTGLNAQEYVHPTDPAVREKLERWQDAKFGVLFHWGLYSLPGIVESWSICSEDVDWISRRDDMTYDEYKKWYWGLSKELNPEKFDPDQWAEVMQDGGARYMIFTTKHHDGFCTFDSAYTDFSIAKGPFAADPRKDMALHVFEAFRKRGFMVGPYFSKPDWHCEGFWNPHFATPNRHVNYDVKRHPELWDSYVGYTRNQLEEITANYGAMDILWLDGGWIAGEQIGLDKVLESARRRNPGLICVDRTIGGRNENYETPERSIPDEPIDHPWESCITLSNDWGWVPDAPYKSAAQVVGMLAEITAKGGCLLLGVGPTADGLIEDREVAIIHEIGDWLRANGKAIYETRPTERYRSGDVWFTASKDGKTIYAIATPKEGIIEWSGNLPLGKMKMVANGKSLKYHTTGDNVMVTLPKGTAVDDMPVAVEFQLK